jgi:predicted nucleotidyltransferase
MPLLTRITDELVQQIAKRIVQQFNPERIIAFGSYARGEHDSDSDLDLLVIMRTDKPFAERTIEVDSIFGLRDWAMDIVVYTPQEFAHQQKVWGTLAATVNAEGKVLYERPR